MIALSLLAIFFITVIIKYILHIRHLERYVKHLHLIQPSYPLIGNSLQVIGKTQTELFMEFIEYINSNGTPCKAYLGPILLIVIDKPEDFKSALMSQNCLDKPYFYEFYPSKVGLMSATCKFIFVT